MKNNIQYQQNKRNSVTEQPTMIIPSKHRTFFNLLYKVLGSLLRPLQCLLVATLKRARDPEPEVYGTTNQDAVEARVATWGWLPELALTSTLGMLSIAYAFSNSRDGGTGLRAFLYLGLLLIYTPIAVRLTSPAVSRAERISLLCIIGACCYFIKVMASPLYFSSYDEFLHWRTADDIIRSGHLFSKNAMLPVSPYYPGLEIVTNALSTLSGLDTFKSGLIVIGIARLLMILILFALNERIFKSARMASIATILYMANPEFILDDSLFAYESLAIPLATFVMLAIESYQPISLSLSRFKPRVPSMLFKKADCGDLRWIMLTAWVALVALALTHHMTNFFLDGVLILWAVTYRFLRLPAIHQLNLARTALLGVLISVAWIGFNGNPVVHYISSTFADTLNELERILAGTNHSRQLFVTYGGQQTPLLDRLMAALSVTLILFCLPFGWLCLWQRYRSNALICTFGIMSLCYPITQICRFTNTGEALTDRSTGLLFIPIASVIAIFITQFWPTRRLNWKHSSLIAWAMSVVLLGGIILGTGPALSRLPGPYVTAGDTRSIGPEGIQAATWAPSHLGSNNRIGTDHTNKLLMGTYGDQHIVTLLADRIDVSPIFFSSRLDPDELSTLRKAQVHYLVVDLRLAQALPLLGLYFAETEPNAFHHATPIDLSALTKFNTISHINKVFDSGNIVIYDTGGLTHAPEKP